MILGASILQLPAIKKAKELGFQVIAVDMDKDAVGFQEADICLEISTLDIPKVVEAAKHYEIDSILTLASDMPIRTIAAVSKELNLVGLDERTALNVTNKAKMRKCLEMKNVPIPKYFKAVNYLEFSKAIEKIEGKIIVKPADNSGSRGVFLIEDKSDLQNINYAFEHSKKYSRNGEIVIEEYMIGPEVSVETLSINGVVYVIAITDKLTTGAPHFVEMGHSQPSLLSDDIKKQIELVTAEAVNSLGILNGPAHTEIIVTKTGPKIVEIGARLGGDNITTQLVPLSTGIDMIKSCIEITMGETPDINPKLSMGSAVRYIESKKGKINSIAGIDKVKRMEGIKQVHFMKKTGDSIGEISSSVDRVGFIISQANNAQNAIELCENASHSIKICVQDEES
ncbi:ATP-grasp domain-containing protein [Bacillus sp. JJ1609]|uniref:ATP-grasp domain-containing protein n=1 Tax=Bacillus sp. JJ1609 TaxID=3122977 RepID=UPI002FFE85A4